MCRAWGCGCEHQFDEVQGVTFGVQGVGLGFRVKGVGVGHGDVGCTGQGFHSTRISMGLAFQHPVFRVSGFRVSGFQVTGFRFQGFKFLDLRISEPWVSWSQGLGLQDFRVLGFRDSCPGNTPAVSRFVMFLPVHPGRGSPRCDLTNPDTYSEVQRRETLVVRVKEFWVSDVQPCVAFQRCRISGFRVSGS